MQNPFASFWMAGYECTDKLNAFGNRVDFLQETGHLEYLEQDYRLLEVFGIRTVREGIRWSQVETSPYSYNWDTVKKMLVAAEAQGIQQVWDLCHFGYPDDLTPLHPLFARRFASLCAAFVRFYRSHYPTQVLIVTPINEVSFISWLGGEVGGTTPYCTGNGWQVKYHLMKAYIEGIEAMLAVDPSIRILSTEPLVNIIAPPDATESARAAAEAANIDQFQVLDILAGKICPELRGRPEYVDLVGLNYYYNNQWIHISNQRLAWQDPETEGGRPLHQLLMDVHARYKRPLILAETSHPGDERPGWVSMIKAQCQLAMERDIPLWGICWYPIIDRPDWDHLTPWHRAGVWDHMAEEGRRPIRVLHQPTSVALLAAIEELKIEQVAEPAGETMLGI